MTCTLPESILFSENRHDLPGNFYEEAVIKKISIVTNCWNEVENIPLFYQRCKAELAKHPQYDYEFIVGVVLIVRKTSPKLKMVAS